MQTNTLLKIANCVSQPQNPTKATGYLTLSSYQAGKHGPLSYWGVNPEQDEKGA